MSLWDSIKHALKPDNHESVGTRIGLYIDPLHWLTGLVGGKTQKNYDAFVNTSGDFLNKQASSVVKPIDRFARKYDPLHKKITSSATGDKVATWIANKPATTAGAIYGGIAGGEALAGLGGGGSAGAGAGTGAGEGAATGSGWGLTSDPVASFGGSQFGGNAGALAQSGGIQGGAGIGSATGGGGSLGWGDYAKLALKAGGNSGGGGSAPPYEGRSAELEHQRQLAEEADRQARLMRAQALQQSGMYSPA